MASDGLHANMALVHLRREPTMSTEDPRTIIAGCDGGDRGRQAVALACTLAGLTAARLLIVGVYPHPALPFPPPIAHREDERRRMEQALRAVRDELAPQARIFAVPGLSPAHALCDTAELKEASTIVVGSRHQPAARMGDADHALQVLRSAKASVLVAPDDRPAPSALRRITVGFDGGASSRDALAVAARLAHDAGGSLTVLSAIPPEVSDWWFQGSSLDREIIEHHRQTRGRELEDAAHETLRGLAPVDAAHELPQGDAVTQLVDASASADLLVLGSRRWGALGRLVLGTVSEAVVRESRCPTLVVPRPHGRGSASVDGAVHAGEHAR
jgi:nucleotide-binding universal stress UspA family protein